MNATLTLPPIDSFAEMALHHPPRPPQPPFDRPAPCFFSLSVTALVWTQWKLRTKTSNVRGPVCHSIHLKSTVPLFLFLFFFLENYTKVWTETEEHRLKEHMQLSAERQQKKNKPISSSQYFSPHVSHTMTRVKNYLFSGKKLNL